MKRQLHILVLATLALVSCLKVETYVDTDPDFGYVKSNSPVNFSWFSRRSLTTDPASKANPTYFVGNETVTGTERHLPSGTSMGVFGYFHPQTAGVAGSWTDANDNYPNLFYNEPVSVSESSGTYTYTYPDSRYWPKNVLDRISFIAYYPYNAHLNTDGSQNESAVVEPMLDTYNKHDGMVSFNYRVPENSEDGLDFMISDLCMDQSKAVWDADVNHITGITGADGTVDGTKVRFYFHHALSQVRVKEIDFDTSQNSDVTVRVDSVKFGGIYVYGNCQPVPDTLANGQINPDPSGRGRIPVTEKWTNLLDFRPGAGKKSGVKAAQCYDESDNFIPENVLLLIPQNPFPAGATISVFYTLTRREDSVTGEYYSYENNVLSAALTTTSVYGWDAGKIYTYNISLNLKSIKLTAEVVDWLEAGEDVFLEQQQTP